MGKKSLTAVSVETALQIYYTKTEIDNKDIMRLFGISSREVISRLKKSARAVMEEKEVECWNSNAVDTECAYEAWRLDVSRLERMHQKLKKLGISEEMTQVVQ